MKKLFALLAVALICFSAFSIPAKRGFVRYSQPDGTVIFLQKHGDEFCHWVTNTAGQVVEKDADGYWRPATNVSLLQSRKAAARSKRIARTVQHKSGEHIAFGQKRFLVILVEFQDLKFSSETAGQDFNNMMNQFGYSDNGGTGSAREYYYDNSHGSFEPIFDVFGPVTLDNNMAYYGANDASGYDQHPELAVKEGCEKLDDQIDFSLYDDDKDGSVDLVYVYYAGYGEADYGEEDTIWPHQWELTSAGISLILDGMTVSTYSCSNELGRDAGYNPCMCGIGTACHEFGHAIGLPDFYDTDYEDNEYCMAMFDYSLMCGGSYNNNGMTPPYLTIEERIMLGWMDESVFQEFSKSGQVTLTSVNDNVAYKTLTDKEGEYFVYECRGAGAWDAYVPAPGLTVTHVDKSSRTVKVGSVSYTARSLWDNWTTSNAINANGKHPCCYIVPPADQSELCYGYRYFSEYQDYYYDRSYDPKLAFPGSEMVTSYTPVSWNGVASDIQLSNIAYANGQVSFYVSIPSDEIDFAVIDNPGGGVYSAGDTFEFNLVASEANPVSSVVWFYDDEPVNVPSVCLSAGSHTVEAEVVLSSGERQTVTLEIAVN